MKDVFRTPYRGRKGRQNTRRAFKRSAAYKRMSVEEKRETRAGWKREDIPFESEDKLISWDRKIIEHYFSRLKGLFPVVRVFEGIHKKYLDRVYRVCMMYLNIIQVFLHPLRDVPCDQLRRCYYCSHIHKQRDDWWLNVTSWFDEMPEPDTFASDGDLFMSSDDSSFNSDSDSHSGYESDVDMTHVE